MCTLTTLRTSVRESQSGYLGCIQFGETVVWKTNCIVITQEAAGQFIFHALIQVGDSLTDVLRVVSVHTL